MDIELEIHWRRRKPLETSVAEENDTLCPTMSEIHSISDEALGGKGNGLYEKESENFGTAANFCLSKISAAPQSCAFNEENSEVEKLSENFKAIHQMEADLSSADLSENDFLFGTCETQNLKH